MLFLQKNAISAVCNAKKQNLAEFTKILNCKFNSSIAFQEEQKRKEQEEAEAKAKKEAKKAAALAKKQARLQAKPDQAQLPKLVSSTYTDLMKRFQPIPKQDPALAPQALERPRVRKLMDNPFEQKVTTMAEDSDKKATKTFSTNNNNKSI